MKNPNIAEGVSRLRLTVCAWDRSIGDADSPIGIGYLPNPVGATQTTGIKNEHRSNELGLLAKSGRSSSQIHINRTQ
jgi:hypothetical protein